MRTAASTTPIAASYARYSTDMQRRESIEDQERKGDKLVRDKLGITPALRFRDHAESGWNNARSDYLKMLDAAKRRQFNVLVLDDLSRLGRDQDERGLTIRRLEFMGVRIISANGYDSTMPAPLRVLTRSATGMVDSMYSIDLADKTHRGLTGQALKGFNAGGRSYGYRSVPLLDETQTDEYGRPKVLAARREIDAEQAETVRLIFALFVQGQSPRAIAHELNRRRIPSPRGSSWAVSAIYGDRRTGCGILNNPLYIGRVIWNRSRWMRDPDSGKRRRIERPESEWIVRDNEVLRIVPAELWEAAQERLRTRKAGPGRRESQLLSGILRCGICGGSYVKVDKYRYGCATHKDRGPVTCGNGMKIRVDVANRTMITGIRQKLLSNKAMEEFKKATAALLRAEKRIQRQSETAARQVAVEREIGNMVAAIKAGAFSEALRGSLTAAEAERAELQKQIADEAKLAAIPDFLPRASDIFRQMIDALDTVLTDNSANARQQLRTLLGADIPLVPHPEDQMIEARIPGAGVFKLAMKMAVGAELDNCGSGGLLCHYLTLYMPASGTLIPAGQRV